MSHVFVSYLRDDREQVDRLVAELEQAGIDVWLDRREIQPGARWQDAIAEAIAEGAFFVACFSSEYAERTRTHMNEELVLAIEELRRRPTHRAWFLPVLLDECGVPDRPIGAGERLSDLQWVSLAEDWHAGVAAIVGAVLAESFGDASPEQRPELARAWRRVQRLAEQLADPASSTEDRMYAARELRRALPSSAALPALRAATADPDPDVRLEAVRGLAAMGPDAADALVDALDSDDHAVRQAVCGALLEFDEWPEGVIPRLVAALPLGEGGEGPTPSAVLACIGEPASPALLAAMEGADPVVARRAASALCAMQPPPSGVKEDLLRLLQHPQVGTRAAAARVVGCLVRSGREADWELAAEPLADAIAHPESRPAAYHALTTLGSAAGCAIPGLVAVLRAANDEPLSPFNSHETAARVLIEIGTPAVTALIALGLDRTDHEDLEEWARHRAARDIALWALGVLLNRTGAADIEECLRDVATSDTDHIVLRVQAAASLAACGVTDPELLGALVTGADPKHTRWPARSAAALHALGAYGQASDLAAPVLVATLRHQGDELLTAAAARTAGELELADALPALRDVAEHHPGAGARHAAVVAIERIDKRGRTGR